LKLLEEPVPNSKLFDSHPSTRELRREVRDQHDVFSLVQCRQSFHEVRKGKWPIKRTEAVQDPRLGLELARGVEVTSTKEKSATDRTISLVTARGVIALVIAHAIVLVIALGIVLAIDLATALGLGIAMPASPNEDGLTPGKSKTRDRALDHALVFARGLTRLLCVTTNTIAAIKSTVGVPPEPEDKSTATDVERSESRSLVSG